MVDNPDTTSFGFDENKPVEKKGGQGLGLFKKKEEKPIGPSNVDILESINAIDRRLRTLESRYNDISRKIHFMDKSNTTERKRIFDELKAADSINLEQKRDITEIRSTLTKVISELKNFAVVEDLNTLKKYIELWDPLNFVTRAEVIGIIEEIIKEKASKKKAEPEIK